MTYPPISTQFTTLINVVGIYGITLSWFTSYLTDRRQAIEIGSCFSDMLSISCCVPQGPILGLLLFIPYTTPLSCVIQGHNFNHHLYADDTHIYVSLTIPDTCHSLNQLRHCHQDVSLRMKYSKLKLNVYKTEFIIIGTSTQRAQLDYFSRHFSSVRVSHQPPICLMKT